MTPEPVTNTDVFLWALYELGGSDDFIDVEAAFYRAFELAPARLSWRTRSDLPDLKKCSKALRDAEGRKPALLVKKGPEQRRLTVEGQKWIEDHFDRLADALGGDRPVQATRSQQPSRLVGRALRSAAFRSWAEEGGITDQKWRVAEMLRCSPDNSAAVFHERLQNLQAAAHSLGRQKALEFFNQLGTERSEWFQEK